MNRQTNRRNAFITEQFSAMLNVFDLNNPDNQLSEADRVGKVLDYTGKFMSDCSMAEIFASDLRQDIRNAQFDAHAYNREIAYRDKYDQPNIYRTLTYQEVKANRDRHMQIVKELTCKYIDALHKLVQTASAYAPA